LYIEKSAVSKWDAEWAQNSIPNISILMYSKLPFKQADISITLLGMTHCTPNKRNTRDHKFLSITKSKETTLKS